MASSILWRDFLGQSPEFMIELTRARSLCQTIVRPKKLPFYGNDVRRVEMTTNEDVFCTSTNPIGDDGHLTHAKRKSNEKVSAKGAKFSRTK